MTTDGLCVDAAELTEFALGATFHEQRHVLPQGPLVEARVNRSDYLGNPLSWY